MAIRVGINGFGRIGRMVYRAALEQPAVEVVAVNDITDAATLAHLLKYDSTHRRFPGKVTVKGDTLMVDSAQLKVLAERDPAKLPWKDLRVDVVVESTGIFSKREDCEKHLQAGAKKVLLSVPPKGEVDAMIVLGANDEALKPEHKIISNASCTTNCLAPLAKVLHETFKIEWGLMTTVHAYTADQRLVDAPHKDLRRARSAAVSIVPTTTGAAKAVGKVIPDLKGKLDGMALRVPVQDGSVTDFVAVTQRDVTVDAINRAVLNASRTTHKGIIEYCEDPVVSVDIIGNPHSSIFDAELTMTMGTKMFKVVSWYDNEWGYSCRCVDLITRMAR
ncbi:MAG: type I glyceraldehyde-3-phosphate dehydrogenase [Candidatus Abyssobacteria bacterium SURF_17]|uniref:Glyceraldehyde-3-phosphate dehydrogenase n=1 Tax=Candidatus Abyssobacteria bacterium SURF_17 TaxID=2093361 RepID=A0A419ETU7_9BACT|nr:MAG: type I glyceraldehyde-3-phosphate dehydrogenase [Candidatus Abyssubacteria bacterium SURF_17]